MKKLLVGLLLVILFLVMVVEICSFCVGGDIV